eukprot:13721999-Alexandrium_andersonii.AAC.1
MAIEGPTHLSMCLCAHAHADERSAQASCFACVWYACSYQGRAVELREPFGCWQRCAEQGTNLVHAGCGGECWTAF